MAALKKVRAKVPYRPRNWARPIHDSFLRWIVAVLHRRAGKTTCFLNHCQRYACDNGLEERRLRFLEPSFTDRDIKDLLVERRYGIILPLLKQAKAVAWGPLKRIARNVPGHTKNESDLSIRYPGGHIVRLFGADNPDSFRGMPFSGVVYDEYSQHPPNIHGEVVSKALADHLGWGAFVGTIRGKNQLYKAHEAAKHDPEWHTLWLDINHSLTNETGATITALRRAMDDDLKQIRMGLMLQEEFDQEWFLSPEAAIRGAILGKWIAEIRAQIRPQLSYEPLLPVNTDWDLGVADYMCIWFSQTLRSGEIHLVDYYQDMSGGGLPAAIKAVKERPYIYGTHYAPHDIEVREQTLGGRSRRDFCKEHGLELKALPNTNLQDQINAARLLLRRCWFDEGKCEAGIEGLRQYAWQYNEKLQQFVNEPLHNWASHASSAFMGMAVRHQDVVPVIPDDVDRDFGGHVIGQDDTSWMGG